MLLSISVKNIALIDNLQIDFHSGMNVFSGETGAGKSIIVDSINLILGERADRGLVRSGCEKAVVEAEFAPTPEALRMLKENEIEPEGNVISIQREITTGERNICRVCGSVVPLAFLRSLTEHLVDLHGQHAHQSLLDQKKHLPFLDSFGDDAFRSQKTAVEAAYLEYREASRMFAALRREDARKQERVDYLTLRIREMKDLAVETGEKQKLTDEKNRLSALEKTDRALREAYLLLNRDSDGGAVQTVRMAAESAASVSTLGEEYSLLDKRLHSLYYELQECAIDLRDRLEREQFDPERYEQVLTRLDAIRKAEKRFGMEADEMALQLETMREELSHFDELDTQLHKAETAFKKSLREYRNQAKQLTEMRKNTAVHFEKMIMTELEELGMKGTVFKCVFDDSVPAEKIKPSQNGDDTVAFYISPNPGEPLSPLDRTASGGELSRVMLAMKSAGAAQDEIPTLIFDEIDTGISGRVAEAVGRKMASIAQFRQVLCVTHLAQIASMADRQFLVRKQVINGRTLSETVQLDQRGRVEEIARLIGVTNAEQSSGMLHASEILENSEKYKREYIGKN